MHAVPNMAVFCSALILCCPGMLFRYCLSDCDGSIRLYYYRYHFCFYIPHVLNFFSASFLITFLSPGNAMSVIVHVLCLSLQIMMSSLLLGIVLSVRTCWFHNMVTLPSWLVLTDFGTWSYQCCCLIFPLFSCTY